MLRVADLLVPSHSPGIGKLGWQDNVDGTCRYWRKL